MFVSIKTFTLLITYRQVFLLDAALTLKEVKQMRLMQNSVGETIVFGSLILDLRSNINKKPLQVCKGA